jgi:hypothetical protein
MAPSFYFYAAVALVTLVVAIRFAFRPAERTLAILRALCAATVFSDLAAFFIGLANVLAGLRFAAERSGGNLAGVTIGILGGVIEALAGLVLGFAVLAVAWLLVAVGLRRQA